MTDTDFGQHAVAVATAFWGEPSKSLSTAKKVCWGSNGGKSVSVEKGTWFDYQADEGGGVLALVMRELGSDKAAAIAWLQTEGFIEGRDPPAGQQQRQERREAPPADEPPFEPDLPPEATNDVPKPVKGYRYTGRDGDLLYEVIRYHFFRPDGSEVIDVKTGNPRKTFKQRRPDGRGGYHWNLGGIGHTIYRHQQVEIAIADGKTILLVEGEKDVETLEVLGWTASTNSGGASHWSEVHAEFFRDADVVILVDNDDAGRAGGEKRARSLRGIAGRVRLLDFADHVPGFPDKHDVSDWMEKFGGDALALDEIIRSLPEWRPKPPASTMGAVGLHQLHHPSLMHDFLIDGFLDRQGVAMMPGASGSGKTFLILEMAMCVVMGADFWGMATKPGLVLYQAGEGKQGVTKRLDGWMIDRGITPTEDLPFRMLTRRVNLFNDDKDTDDLIAEGKAWAEHFEQPVRLVVIDTFNKAITGANENAGQDMTKVLARLERISTALNCAVVVPIHKSAEGKMRGHTSLTGDVSNVINVTELEIKDRNGRVIRTVSLDKNKDGEKGRPMRFVLRQVVLHEDAAGKPVTTCVVDKPDGDQELEAKQGKLSLQQFIILRALKEAIDDFGETVPAGLRAGPQITRVVKYQHWVDRVRKTWIFTAAEGEPEKRNTELARVMSNAGKVLLAGDYIDRDNDKGVVWHLGREDRPQRRATVVAPPPPLPADVRAEIKDMGVPF